MVRCCWAALITQISLWKATCVPELNMILKDWCESYMDKWITLNLSVQLAELFSLSICLLMIWKKERVINVTSTNISPEICQRHNEIFFLHSGARNVSARDPLNESAASNSGKTHFNISRITFIMHCTPGRHQRIKDKEKPHTHNSSAATLLI